MTFRLIDLPFSIAGSYLSVNYLSGRDVPADYATLRTVRGAAKSPDLLRLVPKTPSSGRRDATFVPGLLTVPTASEPVTVEFASVNRLRIIAGSPVDLQDASCSKALTLVLIGFGKWIYINYEANVTLLLTVVEGSASATGNWDGTSTHEATLSLSSGTVLDVEEQLSEPAGSTTRDVPLPSWAEWEFAAPTVDDSLLDARKSACYITWSALVAPSGLLRRPSMLMSKNWMTSVWSWDHCFNALPLSAFPELAWDQLMTIFDHQNPRGALPDWVNDGSRAYTCVKPPIHGWAIRWLHERGFVSSEQLAEAFPILSNWTEWWLRERVIASRKLPHYYHGNDSGWDNSTVFDSGTPIESPDLPSYLVLQLDVMAEIAGMLGDAATARQCSKLADELLKSLIEELWVDGRFMARNVWTGQLIRSTSLLTFQPLVLGDRLPSHIFDALVAQLLDDGFLTEHGLATEQVTSPHYDADGYWRGPIWGAPTLLIVDGLRRGGRADIGRDIAQRFCAVVSRSGAAENFDALTGDGRRDLAYTWTASVFLALASEYAGG